MIGLSKRNGGNFKQRLRTSSLKLSHVANYVIVINWKGFEKTEYVIGTENNYCFHKDEIDSTVGVWRLKELK